MTEMFLFFDTETTGFPHRRKPIGDECQPHVVQLAAMLCEADGLERASINLIIDPLVEIPEVTSDIHGITDDIAARCGMDPETAAWTFQRLAVLASTFVAHNFPFDRFLLDVMFERCGYPPSPVSEKMVAEKSAKTADTLTMARPIMNAAGFKKHNLAAAYEYFMGEKLEGAHDAMVDVRACRDIYFKMID